MDRRHFLKTGVLATGALATGVHAAGAPAAESAAGRGKPVDGKTPLGIKGYVSEPSRRIPVVDTADVVIVGGGPAGVAAAISAARQGVDVLLLERQYFLGGLFTGCGVTPIIDMYSPTPDGGKIQAIKGISEELCKRLDAVNMLNWEKIRPKVDVEAAKYMLERMITEAGVRVLYGVQVAQVTMSGDRIDSVILEGKSGRVAVKTKFVVDCSGDGDILDMTGEDFTVYKDDIGAMWRIGNAGNAPRGNETAVKGVLTRHTTGEKSQDGLDMYNLTRIQMSLRKMMWEDAADMRRNSPGCEDLFLLDTPAVVGVRITRVLNSVSNVTVEGAISGKVYDDVIGFSGTDSTISFNGKKYKSFERKIWQIPYSALTPKTVSNLLAAGRCFGFERGLTYDSREVGTCFMTGQAAGTAAGLAIQTRRSCREIDIRTLQSLLREQNVKLD
jgi:Dehydrogenases (flavoproteins)